MYKSRCNCRNGLLSPPTFAAFLTNHKDNHSYNTRNKNNFWLQVPKFFLDVQEYSVTLKQLLYFHFIQELSEKKIKPVTLIEFIQFSSEFSLGWWSKIFSLQGFRGSCLLPQSIPRSSSRLSSWRYHCISFPVVSWVLRYHFRFPYLVAELEDIASEQRSLAAFISSADMPSSSGD